MAKKQKVPKSIAGVKVPKPLRRGLRDLAASQSGRQALTEALEAACSALCAAQAQPVPQEPPAAAKGRKKPAATDAQGKSGSKDQARATATAALEDAARAFTDMLKSGNATETSPASTATH